jgi:hypothetical protein
MVKLHAGDFKPDTSRNTAADSTHHTAGLLSIRNIERYRFGDVLRFLLEHGSAPLPGAAYSPTTVRMLSAARLILRTGRQKTPDGFVQSIWRLADRRIATDWAARFARIERDITPPLF